MQRIRSGPDELRPIQTKGRAVEAAAQPPSLANHERAGCHVPDLRLASPIGVESTGGDIAKIESGGPGAADRLALDNDPIEIDKWPRSRLDFWRKARRHQGLR